MTHTQGDGMKRIIESTTASKLGWGRARYRRVAGLTDEEQEAVKRGDLVWFRFKPWHYTQSGFKVVTHSVHGWDSREPTPAEIAAITALEETR